MNFDGMGMSASKLSRIMAMDYATKDVVTITQDTTVSDAVRIMAGKSIRRLPVTDGRGRVFALFTSNEATAALMRASQDYSQAGASFQETLSSPVRRYVLYGYSTLPRESTIQDAVDVMSRKCLGAVILAGPAGQIAGIITERDVVRIVKDYPIEERVALSMSKQVYTVTPNQTLPAIMSIMVDRGVRRCPVAENGNLMGIVTETDVLRLFASEKTLNLVRTSRSGEVLEMRAEDFMTRKVLTAFPDATMSYAAEIMEKNRVGCLVVKSENKVVGVITEKDLVNALRRKLA